ncbi:MAG: hypothetical protein LCH81_07020 [Bacteroidetes bacterium]|nr:hypothetical protein [Bacteroidota bacterium]
MKHLFSIFFFALLTVLVSCKKIDQDLLSQMNNTVSEMHTRTEAFDLNTQGIVQFANLVDAAPEALKNDTLSGFVKLHEKVTALKIKQEGTVREYKELLAELQRSAEEYASGKITTDQARSQQESLKGRLTAIEALLEHVGKLNEEAQTEYGKLMAEFKSKTE